MRLTEVFSAIAHYPTENQRKVKFSHIDLVCPESRIYFSKARKMVKKEKQDNQE